MIDNQNSEISFIKKIYKRVIENYKVIISIFIIIFIIFISYQYFQYSKIKKIKDNSIKYFDTLDMNKDDNYLQVMQELSSNSDFYSVLAKLKIIELDIDNKNYKSAENLYLDILKNSNLKSEYRAAIATNASYKFINIIYNNFDNQFISSVEAFITYINDDISSYQIIKLEIKYLLEIAKLDINNISLQNNSEASNLYNLIMDHEDASSSIKERINKIHEFQLYK